MQVPPPPSAPPETWTSLPIFANLGPDGTARVREAMQSVVFHPGQALMRQGEIGNEMFVLERGSARVVVRDDEGAVTFERVTRAPAILGEMAVVTHEPRNATVTAEEEVLALRMNREVLDALCERSPQSAMLLTSMVGERLMAAAGIRKVGKYQVLGRLGAGGMATVFEAVHPTLGIPVALKMLSHSLALNKAFAENFGREARRIAQMSHEHIVRVLDTEQAYGTHFIVMEKLTGALLEEVIDAGDRLEWPLVRRILIETADALAYTHRAGLIHRDIKPSNVFLTVDKRVKLLDFGIAVDAARAADHARVMGTPYYMSPEQILGQALDGRADQYSLGIMAYELCTHAQPFQADTVPELFQLHLDAELPDPRLWDPEVPADLVEFMRIATAKHREDRFATCQEAAEFLKRAGDAAVPDPMETSVMSMTYLPSRRAEVQRVLQETAERLSRIRGVQLFQAHQVAEDAQRPS